MIDFDADRRALVINIPAAEWFVAEETQHAHDVVSALGLDGSDSQVAKIGAVLNDTIRTYIEQMFREGRISAGRAGSTYAITFFGFQDYDVVVDWPLDAALTEIVGELTGHEVEDDEDCACVENTIEVLERHAARLRAAVTKHKEARR